MDVWQEKLQEYMDSDEGKGLLEQIKASLVVRKKAIDNMKDFSIKFIDSKEFKEFWERRPTANDATFLTFLEETFGEKLIDAMKSVTVSHLCVSISTTHYVKSAINVLLEEIGVPMFHDCMKEMHFEKKNSIFEILFERIEGIAQKLGTAVMVGFMDTNAVETAMENPPLENVTLH